MSKGIDLKKLSEFFDNDLRLVKEHEFRRAIFTGSLNTSYTCFGNVI